jgi:hypothetical protein
MEKNAMNINIDILSLFQNEEFIKYGNRLLSIIDGLSSSEEKTKIILGVLNKLLVDAQNGMSVEASVISAFKDMILASQP